jgi:hypothetical protein
MWKDEIILWCFIYFLGNYTLRVDCTPLLYQLVYKLTKEVNKEVCFTMFSDEWINDSYFPPLICGTYF